MNRNTISAPHAMRTLMLALATALTLLVTAFAATAGATTQAEYVALGDSYTSAAGVLPPSINDVPLGCSQSTLNYPHLINDTFDFTSFVDVSCGGATTDDFTGSQSTPLGTNPPQFNALTQFTHIVTMGIGGNDVGFGSIVLNCVAVWPFGSPCKDKYVVNNVDTLRQTIDNTAPKIAAAIQGVHSRSPGARIFVVGYPRIVNPTGWGCWPNLPIAFGDAPYLDGIEQYLNSMLKSQAQANGATYVDTFTPSIGHDSCKPIGIRWVEPVIPVGSYVPVHPNVLGEYGMYRAVLAAIGTP